MPGKFTLITFHPREWLVQSILSEERQQRGMANQPANLIFLSTSNSGEDTKDASDCDQWQETKMIQTRDLGHERNLEISEDNRSAHP